MIVMFRKCMIQWGWRSKEHVRDRSCYAKQLLYHQIR